MIFRNLDASKCRKLRSLFLYFIFFLYLHILYSHHNPIPSVDELLPFKIFVNKLSFRFCLSMHPGFILILFGMNWWTHRQKSLLPWVIAFWEWWILGILVMRCWVGLDYAGDISNREKWKYRKDKAYIRSIAYLLIGCLGKLLFLIRVYNRLTFLFIYGEHWNVKNASFMILFLFFTTSRSRRI